MNEQKRVHPKKEIKAGGRQPVKHVATPARPHARNVWKTVSEGSVSHVHPFGPQSHWSYLVSQRELLQEEIDRGKRCLEQLRKDLAECTTVFGTWPGSSSFKTWTATSKQSKSHSSSEVEEFFGGWLNLLEQNLGSVTKEIDNMSVVSTEKRPNVDESMFALLRAAG
jgi:hypothetical protein